jgi:hypothetical protein
MTDTTPVDAPEDEHPMSNETAAEVVENDTTLQQAGAESDPDSPDDES